MGECYDAAAAVILGAVLVIEVAPSCRGWRVVALILALVGLGLWGGSQCS